ncbi:hypothetical protein LT493_40455 [Streptomyces tricolor]|nr:hypothetical protein [Streptomyces tricolor]
MLILLVPVLAIARLPHPRIPGPPLIRQLLRRPDSHVHHLRVHIPGPSVRGPRPAGARQPLTLYPVTDGQLRAALVAGGGPEGLRSALAGLDGRIEVEPGDAGLTFLPPLLPTALQQRPDQRVHGHAPLQVRPRPGTRRGVHRAELLYQGLLVPGSGCRTSR